MSIINPKLSGFVTHRLVMLKGQTVLEATYMLLINLYLLKLRMDPKLVSVNTSTTLSLSHDILHRRFGHPSKEAISRLPKAVKGVDSVGPPSDAPCDGCAKGKQHRLPFKPSNKRASKPGEGTHMDLVGPMDESIDGYRYFAGFVDDHSSLG